MDSTDLYSSDSESDNDSDNETINEKNIDIEEEEEEEEEEPETEIEVEIEDAIGKGEKNDIEEDDSEEDSDSEDEQLNLENTYIPQIGGGDSDEDEDEDINSNYLQKFNDAINKNYIVDNHPECTVNNYDEIAQLTKIVRDKSNSIIDDLHKSIPFLTKYERTRVIGQRAKQINSGATAFIKVPEHIIDGYLIAELELAQKRIPFIIRRPIPGGGSEYWNLKDLEIVSF
jgi:DNA-directed RNA polymerase I, II, and III subunit RPABC2